MFFLGPGYVQSIVHNFIRHSAQKKKENCAEEVGLEIVRSSFILDRLSTCQINHFLFSSVSPSLKSQMFLSLIILASESL